MKPQLNTREQHLVNSFMKPFKIDNTCPVYWDLVTKVINQQLLAGPITDAANKMLHEIIFKIASAKFDQEFDKLFSEANAIDLEVKEESTRAQSLKKINVTENHREILSLLNKEPGLSRREIAETLGWHANRVTPRIKELLDLNEIKVLCVKYDSVTDRNVQSLGLV